MQALALGYTCCDLSLACSWVSLALRHAGYALSLALGYARCIPSLSLACSWAAGGSMGPSNSRRRSKRRREPHYHVQASGRAGPPRRLGASIAITYILARVRESELKTYNLRPHAAQNHDWHELDPVLTSDFTPTLEKTNHPSNIKVDNWLRGFNWTKINIYLLLTSLKP
jgi:hypothetical protein